MEELKEALVERPRSSSANGNPPPSSIGRPPSKPWLSTSPLPSSAWPPAFPALPPLEVSSPTGPLLPLTAIPARHRPFLYLLCVCAFFATFRPSEPLPDAVPDGGQGLGRGGGEREGVPRVDVLVLRVPRARGPGRRVAGLPAGDRRRVLLPPRHLLRAHLGRGAAVDAVHAGDVRLHQCGAELRVLHLRVPVLPAGAVPHGGQDNRPHKLRAPLLNPSAERTSLLSFTLAVPVLRRATSAPLDSSAMVGAQ